jgi:hypothetical protein
MSYDKKAGLGSMGEKIVAKYLRGCGRTVEESINPLDNEKDLLVDGKKIEVKTQVPFLKENAFSFRENQLKKCLGVEEVWFVNVPSNSDKYPDEHGGFVFKIKAKEMQYSSYMANGTKMIKVPRDQKGMEKVFRIIDEEVLVKMMENSSSGYNKGALKNGI